MANLWRAGGRVNRTSYISVGKNLIKLVGVATVSSCKKSTKKRGGEIIANILHIDSLGYM